MRLRRGIFMLCSLLFSLVFTFANEMMFQCSATIEGVPLPNFFPPKVPTTSDSEHSTNPSETAGINSSPKNNPLKRGRDGNRNDFSDAVNNNNNKKQRTSDGEVPAGINSSPPPSAALFPFSSSPPDNIIDHDFRDLVIGRSRRLFERNTTRGPLQHLRSILCNRLIQLTITDPTFEVGLEISDSAYLFKLLEGHDDSNLEFENIIQKAVRGAALLQEGVKLVREVQDQLKYAMKDMSCHTELKNYNSNTSHTLDKCASPKKLTRSTRIKNNMHILDKCDPLKKLMGRIHLKNNMHILDKCGPLKKLMGNTHLKNNMHLDYHFAGYI